MKLLRTKLLWVLYCLSAAGNSEVPARDLISTSSNFEAGRKLLMVNPRAALAAAKGELKSARMLSPSSDRVRYLAEANWLAGAAYVALNQPANALIKLEEGLKGGIEQLSPNSKLVGDLYMAQSIALLYSNNVEAALPNIQRAYVIYGLNREARSQALALQNLGSIYLSARDFPNALKYYAQAANTFKSDPALLVTSLYSRGSALIESGNAAQAEQEFVQALAVARAMDSSILQLRCLVNLARAQVAGGKLVDARHSVNQAYALSGAAAGSDWLPALDWVSAEIAFRRGDTDRAAALITRIFKGVDLFSANLAQRDYLRTGYEVFKAKGDQRQALRYLEAYKQVDDKARAVAASASAALMSARFDFAGQQARIQQLRANETVQAAAASARLRNALLKAVSIGASVIVTLLLFGFFSIRRSRDEVRAANADLSDSNQALEKALAARTEFLATTSHEIRTPLNGILGMTQVLLADRALDPPVRGKIELVHGAGETMKALVDDLLDVAKMTTGKITIRKEQMDLARLLRDAGQVWAGQAESRGIGIVLDTEHAPRMIVEDEVRLRQIVFNLMSNAIKFTDQGQVRLSASVVDEDMADPAGQLRIEVADTGIGIPPDQIDAVFESFRQVDGGTTRRHGGTGLGLSICRSLARAMGGDVVAVSTIGIGSTFTLTLPLVASASNALRAHADAPVMLADATVLLVEVNPLSQSVLRAVLGPHVAEVRVASSRDEAGRAIASAAIDLVLADATTLGFDLAAGAALARPLLNRGGRFVWLWSGLDEHARAKASTFGLTDMIGKPIGAADLVAALKALYGDDPVPREVAA